MRAWHFTDGMFLRDGQPLVVGKTYTHDGPLVLCNSGLHASNRLLDALSYAHGGVVSRVECGGEMLEDVEQFVCRKRTVLWAYNAEKVLRHFARLCALDVIHLWDAPDVVVQYLKTGDDSLRHDAKVTARSFARSFTRSFIGSAAKSTAWNAAEFAAWSAAKWAAESAAELAAWKTAKSVAKPTTWSTAGWVTRITARWAVEAVAEAEARGAAVKRQNRRLTRMLREGRKRNERGGGAL